MILIGGGGHGKVVLETLLLNGEQVERIYDGNPAYDELYGVPVLKDKGTPEGNSALISIGDNVSRKSIAAKYALNYVTAVHPAASVSPFASVGEGSVILACARVSPAAMIGKHCIINTGAVIEHDCTIGDFVHLSPNATLAGSVRVGEGTKIGIGACVLSGIRVGSWAVIGAGTVITDDVPDHAVILK